MLHACFVGMPDQDATDITQMMSAPNPEIRVASRQKSSKLLWVVLGCVVVGVGLGVFVYQQSLAPQSTPNSTPSPIPVSSPAPSAQVPNINAIDQTVESNTITFPQAGTVQVDYDQLKPATVVPTTPTLIVLTPSGSSNSVSVTTPTSAPGTPMASMPTTLNVTAGQTVTIQAFNGNSASEPAIGWVKPSGSLCGKNGFGTFDISSALSWAQSQEGSLPIVSSMCWSEYNPNSAKDTSAWAFNDFYIILTYVPNVASPSPSPTPTPKPTPTPSASPSPSPSASSGTSLSCTATAASCVNTGANWSVSVTPSQSVTNVIILGYDDRGSQTAEQSYSATQNGSKWTAQISQSDLGGYQGHMKADVYLNSDSSSANYCATVVATVGCSGASASSTTYASPEAAMPSAGSALPVTGVFEVTEGTLGAGFVFLILGALGLLLL